MLDAFGLLCRGLAGDGSGSGVDEGFVQPLVAAMSVVRLLATIVGLDDEGVGTLSNIARGAYLAVKSVGHVFQQGVEGHLQCSFRIHSRSHLAPTVQELWLALLCVLVHVLTARPGRPAEGQFANAFWDSVCMQLREPGAGCLELLRARLAAASARRREAHGRGERWQQQARAGENSGGGGGVARTQHAVS